MATDRIDPFCAFNFKLEIDGISGSTGFSEVSGLTTETDIVEYRNGDEMFNNVRKLSGLNKFTNITLKRGYTDSKDLWQWRKEIMGGAPKSQIKRKGGSIVLLDDARQEALRWNFRDGWINKWEGPAFNAKNNEVAIESIEIAVEGLELKE